MVLFAHSGRRDHSTPARGQVVSEHCMLFVVGRTNGVATPAIGGSPEVRM